MPSLSQQPGLPSHPWELLGHLLPLVMAHSRARGYSSQEAMPSSREQGMVVYGGLQHKVGFFLPIPHPPICNILLLAWAPSLLSIRADELQCQHICTSLCYSIPLTFFWGGGVAPAWQWARARPLPCRGRQAVCSPRPLLSLEDAVTCSNNHCCLPGSSASSPCSLCSPGINRSVRPVLWEVSWYLLDLCPGRSLGVCILPLLALGRCRAKPRSLGCLPILGHRWSSTIRAGLAVGLETSTFPGTL